MDRLVLKITTSGKELRDMSTQVNHSWEKVAQGRYATEYQGHILQAIRTEEPYHPEQRPYIAVVDRVPLEPGSWSLAEAKTKAIKHVQHKLFGKPVKTNGHKPTAQAAPISLPIVSAEPQPELVPEPLPVPVDLAGVLEVFEEPILRSSELDPGVEQVQTPNEPVQKFTATLTATITDPDVLKALTAFRETLSLMREIADVRCIVNLPPTMEL
jgi:hypothetical protein